MKKYLVIMGLLAAGLLGFYSCSSSSSGEGDDDAEAAPAANTGAAVASIFSSGSSESISAELVRAITNIARQGGGDDEEQFEEGDGEGGPEGAGERGTCDDPDGNGDSDGPEEINTPLTGTSGTYGDAANNNTITVDQDDFCVGDDGAENEGDDLFASFELENTVTGTCTDDTTVSMTAGEGIWRNTDDCFPEIYGTFTMNGTEIDCHICMAEDQTLSGDNSSCSAGGSAVTLNSDVECTLSTSGSEDDEEDTGDSDDEEMGDGDGCETDAECDAIADGGVCNEGFCELACSSDADCDVLDQAFGSDFSCEGGFCRN